MSDSVNPWAAARQASLFITNSQSLLKLRSFKSLMPPNHLILCRPSLLLPSVFPSIRVFSSESVLRIQWPKYWSFTFRISPANEYSGLIAFRMDWLDLLAVQGTLKSLLQHHSSKASILRHSAFSTVQLSHPYMTTGKTIHLTKWTFVSKIMSLLFNMLFRLVIAFLPRNKCLLISWFQSPPAVILKPPKNRVSHCVHCFPISVQFSSVAQSCPTLCNPINRSMPGLPIHHQLSEFTQTHVHRVGDAIQLFHPLSSPFPPAPNPSQHQSLFQWVNSSHEVAKVLEFQL